MAKYLLAFNLRWTFVLILCYGVAFYCFAAQTPNTESAGRAFAQSLENRVDLPVTDNRFVVDKNVTEIQILIMTNDPQSLTILSADGKNYTMSGTDPNVLWQKIGDLYGVKITTPFAGFWEVKGKLLAKPQVIVTSHFELVTPNYANNMIRGETVVLSAFLQNQGTRITDAKILDHTDFIATVYNIATDEKYVMYLKEDRLSQSRQHTGFYHFEYRLDNLPGVYDIEIKAVSLLFQRERRQQIYLHDYPAEIATQIVPEDDELVADVNLLSPIIDASTSQFSATFHKTDGSLQVIALKKISDKAWKLVLPINENINDMVVAMVGYTIDHRYVDIIFPSVNVGSMYTKAYAAHADKIALRWRQYWEKSLDEQMNYLFPFSQGKLEEQLIDQIGSPFTGVLKPLPLYPTYDKELLRHWRQYLFSNPINFLFASQDQSVAKPAPKAKPNIAKVATKPVVLPAKPKTTLAQKILISFLIVLILALVGAGIGGAWYLWRKSKNKVQDEKSQQASLPQEQVVEQSEAIVQEKPEEAQKASEQAKKAPEPPQQKPQSVQEKSEQTETISVQTQEKPEKTQEAPEQPQAQTDANASQVAQNEQPPTTPPQ